MKFHIQLNPRIGFFTVLTLLLIMLIIRGCSLNNDRGEISGSGTIEAIEVNISSKAVGEVLSMPVEEGTRVETGDTLAIIDHSTLDLHLKQGEANLDLMEAQLQLLLSGARVEDIQQAEEALKQAEANMKNAESDLERIKELFRKQSATRKQYDDAEARYTVTLAQYNSARQAFKKLRNWARPEEIRAARARKMQAEASVEIIKKSISDCYITAPIKGVVTNKPIEIGELAIQGAAMVTVSNTSVVYLMIYVTEPYLGKINIGQDAEISIDSFPDSVLPGKVIYISPIAEFTPKNIQTEEDRVKLVFGVKIEVPNRDEILKPGMPADAVIKYRIPTSK